LRYGRRSAPRDHIGCVSLRPEVATLTADAWMQAFQIELVAANRVGRMAVETCLRLVRSDRAADRLVNGFGHQLLIAGGDFEALNRRIIADSALIQVAVALQNPSLRLRPHRPDDRNGDRLSSVAHRVNAVAILGHHRIQISILAKGQAGMPRQYIVMLCRLHGMGHLRGRLRQSLLLVTGCASDAVLFAGGLSHR
jgi:hypothetical protein